MECRRRRIKCDAGHPCTPCVKHFDYNRRLQPDLVAGMTAPECVYQPVVHGSEEEGEEDVPVRRASASLGDSVPDMMHALVNRVCECITELP